MELTYDMLETNLAATSHYPSAIPLMTSPGKLKCQTVSSALRYFTPNKNRNYNSIYDPDSILSISKRLPNLKIDKIKISRLTIVSNPKADNSNTKKFAAPDATNTVNRNRSIMEFCCEPVDEALLKYNTEGINNDDRIKENSFTIKYSVFECQRKANF